MFSSSPFACCSKRPAQSAAQFSSHTSCHSKLNSPLPDSGASVSESLRGRRSAGPYTACERPFLFLHGRGAFFSFRQGEKKRMGGALRGSCPLCNNIKEARANVRLCRNCLKKREARRTFLQIIDIPHKERYNFSCKNQKHFIDRMLLKTGRLCRRFQ